MSNKKRKGYQLITSAIKGQLNDAEKVDLKKVYNQISELCKEPSPDNLYKIAQLISFSSNDILDQRLNFLENIADTRNGAEGDNPEFTVPYSGVIAEIGAKGSTPKLTRVFERKVVIPTVQASARIGFDHQDFVNRPQLIVRAIVDTAIAMENAIVKHVFDRMLQHYEGLGGTPNYVTGDGYVKAAIDNQLNILHRFGRPVIMGDITALKEVSKFAGFVASTDGSGVQTIDMPSDYIKQMNENRILGVYDSSDLVELGNRYVNEFSIEDDNLLLPLEKLLFMTVAGQRDRRNLKFFRAGSVRTSAVQIPEDESYQMYSRTNIGVGFVGNQNTTMIYKNTAE